MDGTILNKKYNLVERVKALEEGGGGSIPVATEDIVGGVLSGDIVTVDESGNMGVNVTIPSSNDNYTFSQDSNGKVTITKTTGAGVVSTIECIWNETPSARTIDGRFTIVYGSSGPWRVKLLAATIDYPIDTEWSFAYGATPTVPALIFENEIVTVTLNNVVNDMLRRIAALESNSYNTKRLTTNKRSKKVEE